MAAEHGGKCDRKHFTPLRPGSDKSSLLTPSLGYGCPRLGVAIAPFPLNARRPSVRPPKKHSRRRPDRRFSLIRRRRPA